MKPTQPQHFLGKAGRIAKVLFDAVPEIKTNRQLDTLDRCFLFHGPPGTGKSSLAECLALAIAGSKHEIEKINGQSCNVEVIRRWMADSPYFPLFGQCKVRLIEEIDAMSIAACNDARTWLDDLAPRNVVIATTNKTIKELQEQLQSRFQQWEFEKVNNQSIADWLVLNYRLAKDVAARIAAGAKGNVRVALADAKAVSLAMKGTA